MGMSCLGEAVFGGEPFSLIGDMDKRARNVLLLAYEKPIDDFPVDSPSVRKGVRISFSLNFVKNIRISGSALMDSPVILYIL